MAKAADHRALRTAMVYPADPEKAQARSEDKESGGGNEFNDHQRLARMLDSKIYFTHPYSLWEKGLIEYTNKLFRQYIPKKANFDDYNDTQIKEIQYRINSKPRYKFNFYLPKEMFFLNLNNKVAFNG